MADTNWWPSLADGTGRKHHLLKVSIRRAIAQGEIGPGTRLPPVREVAWRLGVTPGTVARAYKDLVDDQVLTAQVGRGTYVADGGPKPIAQDEPYLLEPLPPGSVNLRTSQVPDVGQAAVIHDLLRDLPPPESGDYVTYPLPDHDIALRRRLADWVTTPAHGPIAAEDMVLTLGGQHGMVVLMQTLLHGPRPMVLTEDLAYPGFRHAAGLVRVGIVGVPFDADGLLPEALDRIATETGAQVLCTSAEAHNPTTIRTAPERRAAIVGVARAHGLQIVDDECFDLTERRDPSYRRLAPERAWVVASLSKSLSPDLRIGAVIAPEGRAGGLRLVAQQQFFGLPRPAVTLAEALLASGRAEGIRAAVQARIADRVARTRAALAPFDATIRDGVPFVWLRMPRGWRASSFLRAAEAEGIRLKAADEFALIDGRAPNAVRIALTAEPSEALFDRALARLVALLNAPPLEIDV